MSRRSRYLKRFTNKYDTQELRALASEKAIVDLKKEVITVAFQYYTGLTVDKDLYAPEQIHKREQALKTGSSAQVGTETADLLAHLRSLHAAGRLSDEQYALRLTGHAIAAQQQSNRDCLRAGLDLLQTDLRKRETSAFITSRDVHKHVVKAQCDARMCRWCELPTADGVGSDDMRIGDAIDPTSGYPDFGPADYFLSYNWDTPWSELIDALETHSLARKADGSAAADGSKPVYYWIDIFAVNQHEPWTCDRTMREEHCPGCKAVDDDMHDFATADPENPKGFERVIAFTQKTVMLMEPWDKPRPPTRVWCLFEGNTTLAKGGKLEVVLGRKQKRDMQRAMADRFSALEQSLASIEVRRAEATMVADREKIFKSIEAQVRGFDGLNDLMKGEMQRWLADAAVELVERQRPGAQPLGASDLEIEMQSHAREHGGDMASCWFQLANRAPRFASLAALASMLCFCLVLVLVTVGTLGGVAPWADAGGARGGPVALLGLVFPLASCLGICCLLPLLYVCTTLRSLQEEHQLRTPPLVKQGKNARAIIACGTCMFAFALIVFPIAGAAWGVGGLFIWYAVAYGCFWFPVYMVKSDQEAMLQRTQLAIKAGWVELQLGRADAATLVFLDAHNELLAALGSDRLEAWSAFPGLLAAAKQAHQLELQPSERDGRLDASKLRHLRSTFEQVATKHLEAHNKSSCRTAACSSEAGKWRTHQATVLLANGDEHDVVEEVLEVLTDASEKYGACIEASVKRKGRSSCPDEADPAWAKFTGKAS